MPSTLQMADVWNTPQGKAALAAVSACGAETRKRLFASRLLGEWNERARRRFLSRLRLDMLSPENRLIVLRERLKVDRVKPYLDRNDLHMYCREIVECGRDIRARNLALKFMPAVCLVVAPQLAQAAE